MKTKFIVLGLIALALVVGVVASTIVNDLFLTIGTKVLINDTSYYTNSGSSKLTKAYDVVICSYDGTNQEVYQECDVVNSVGVDLIPQLSNVRSDSIYLRKGVYTVVNWTTVGFIGTTKQSASWVLFNDTTIECEPGVILNVSYSSYPSDGRLAVIYNENTNNVKIHNCEINGNSLNSGSIETIGIYNKASNNFEISNNYIHDIYQFQIFNYNNSWGIIHDNYLKGIGINDVIGGAGGNLIVSNNRIIQTNEVGSYDAAFNMVRVTNLKVENNNCDGHIAFGYEGSTSHNNSDILGNTISSIGDGICINVRLPLTTGWANNINIIDNLCRYGKIEARGDNYIISNNNIYQPSGDGIKLLNLTNSIVSNNLVINTGDNGIYLIQSANNSIINNEIRNIGTNDKGIFLEYSFNNLVSSNFVSDASTNGIFVRFSNMTSILSNQVYNSNRVKVDYGDAIRLQGAYNTTIMGNTIIDTDSYTIYGIRDAVSNSNQTYISDNRIVGFNTSAISVYITSYADDFNYTTMPTCSTPSVFSGKWITNYSGGNYAQSICIGDRWYSIPLN